MKVNPLSKQRILKEFELQRKKITLIDNAFQWVIFTANTSYLGFEIQQLKIILDSIKVLGQKVFN